MQVFTDSYRTGIYIFITSFGYHTTVVAPSNLIPDTAS